VGRDALATELEADLPGIEDKGVVTLKLLLIEKNDMHPEGFEHPVLQVLPSLGVDPISYQSASTWAASTSITGSASFFVRIECAV